jgi:hypothetical protein
MPPSAAASETWLKGHYRSAQERLVAQRVPPLNSGFLGKHWNRGSRFWESTSAASGASDETLDPGDPILVKSLVDLGDDLYPLDLRQTPSQIPIPAERSAVTLELNLK